MFVEPDQRISDVAVALSTKKRNNVKFLDQFETRRELGEGQNQLSRVKNEPKGQ